MSFNKVRLFYTPGIISLTFLAFIFIYFAEREIENSNQAVIPLFLWDPIYQVKYPEFFTDWLPSGPPNRNYTNILFTGNEIEDRVKLEYGKLLIREMISSKKISDGVHFRFSDNSHYGTFVKTLDVLIREDAKTYLFYDKDIWFYQFAQGTTGQATELPLFVCGMEYEPVNIDWWEETAQRTVHIWNKSWEIILLFVGFISLVVISSLIRGKYI